MTPNLSFQPISRAFDLEAVDRLLLLSMCPKDYLVVSGDGLLHFARLIAASLASVELKANNAWQIVTYAVNISEKGKQLIEAWRQGDRARLSQVLGGPVPGTDSSGGLPAEPRVPPDAQKASRAGERERYAA